MVNNNSKIKFTEDKLEKAFEEIIKIEGYNHLKGDKIKRNIEDVLIESDLKKYLANKYKKYDLKTSEIDSIIKKFKLQTVADLYEANKIIFNWIQNGIIFKREDDDQKDILIEPLDYYDERNNIFKFVTQFEIVGNEKRIPDGIIFINGFPLVVLEFKSAIREDATIFDAYSQITNRYKRDIPELFKYNAFCIISDGVNNKAGSFFSSYEYFYSWRRIAGLSKDVDGIDSMFTLVKGMLNNSRLLNIINNFILFPDTSKQNEKIVCRYPQYYAATSLYNNIKIAQKPNGDGKGGTYFGATGSGKSFIMLYLTRLLMKSKFFKSPTIILITDRIDLDDQLSEQFTNAKKFIGDDTVISVNSRNNLRDLLKGKKSGGVFLTTIQKFTEDTKLLSERSNIICISDEAHRSQINLDQKIEISENLIKKKYGFAKYLHDSFPNATYVGFTGTPIDATLDVFGRVIDSYTMTDSVIDEITVRIVYEGRAAKIALNNSELEKIENYYDKIEKSGANIYQVEKSKKETAKMNTILSNPKLLKNIAEDFISHYESRYFEGSTIEGKTMIVCSTREIAYEIFKNIIKMKPEWNKIKNSNHELSNVNNLENSKPIELIKMVMTRDKDDDVDLYNALGTPEYRKTLDNCFKNEKSNFKIAIVVDMWLTGFNVPSLDSMYIFKPIKQHNLIQTISRVNRKYKEKNKGLVVDYLGIKKQMNLALAKYSKNEDSNFEDISESIIIFRDHLDLLSRLFNKFDTDDYFNGSELKQLQNLNKASEFVQQSIEIEKKFMDLVRRLKSAYDICVGSEDLKKIERDFTHYYLSIRSIISKITKGDAPDTHKMNERVRQMIENALKSDGVEEIFKLNNNKEIDLFNEDYLNKINEIKLPNTKIKLLQKHLAKVIGEIKKVNRLKGIDFTKKMYSLVDKYNQREEGVLFNNEAHEKIASEITDLILEIHKEYSSGKDLGISFEEKAFYDILKELCFKYAFTYPESKLIDLSIAIKQLIEKQSQYPDWNKREDIKASLKVDLILILDKFEYPPVEREEVYVEIFEQAENYKKNFK